eukprot:893602-Rhodomonas_salina.1
MVKDSKTVEEASISSQLMFAGVQDHCRQLKNSPVFSHVEDAFDPAPGLAQANEELVQKFTQTSMTKNSRRIVRK